LQKVEKEGKIFICKPPVWPYKAKNSPSGKHSQLLIQKGRNYLFLFVKSSVIQKYYYQRQKFTLVGHNIRRFLNHFGRFLKPFLVTLPATIGQWMTAIEISIVPQGQACWHWSFIGHFLERLPGVVGSKPGSSRFHLFSISHFHHFTADPQRLPFVGHF
jgi:hypothetical protein